MTVGGALMADKTVCGCLALGGALEDVHFVCD